MPEPEAPPVAACFRLWRGFDEEGGPLTAWALRVMSPERAGGAGTGMSAAGVGRLRRLARADLPGRRLSGQLIRQIHAGHVII